MLTNFRLRSSVKSRYFIIFYKIQSIFYIYICIYLHIYAYICIYLLHITLWSKFLSSSCFQDRELPRITANYRPLRDAMRLVTHHALRQVAHSRFVSIAVSGMDRKCSVSITRLFSFVLLFDWFLHGRVKLRAPMPVGALERTHLERWGAFESGRRGTCSRLTSREAILRRISVTSYNTLSLFPSLPFSAINASLDLLSRSSMALTKCSTIVRSRLFSRVSMRFISRVRSASLHRSVPISTSISSRLAQSRTIAKPFGDFIPSRDSIPFSIVALPDNRKFPAVAIRPIH